tara:strand:+ start:150 stop:380 length:231 start_codon:yes stop_codon:yes gene_type:complete
MKIVIDTDDYNKEGVAQVLMALRKVKEIYPDADPTDVMWSFIHLTASAGMEGINGYVEAYLPIWAKVMEYTKTAGE